MMETALPNQPTDHAGQSLRGDPHGVTGDHTPPGHHDPHLAHHFETMSQQYDTGKLGMWIFLSTEILMFGGLFCAYAVYRANNPDVFAFAHKQLDTTLGAINTVILIASSLTMAWAVRAAQLGQKTILMWCLALSLLGGFGFLAIKTIEYTKKYNHHLWVGTANKYHPKHESETAPGGPGHNERADVRAGAVTPATTKAGPTIPDAQGPMIDRSVVPAPLIGPDGVNPAVLAEGREIADADKAHAGMQHEDLAAFDKGRVHIFFQIYYLMTGLHGLHVVIGMGLMIWLLVRASKNEFGPRYFIPVDLVGLYWHLVDLIWIFLFPLLYLIH